MRWLTSLLSILIALLISEHVVRYVSPAPKIFRFLLGQKESSYELSNNPILGYQIKPGVRSKIFDCHNTFESTNSFGQRDIERSLARVPGKHRILMLGDSVVAGHGLCKTDSTISRKLEKLYGDHNTEVLNFGVGGYCTRAEAELLKVKGVQFKPDEVLLIFVNNDYINSNGSIVNQIKSSRSSTIEWAFKKSHIFRWISLNYNLFHFADDFDPMNRHDSNLFAIGDNNIEDGLKLIAQLAENYSFKVTVILWPYFTDSAISEPWPISAPSTDGPLLIETLSERYGFKSYRLTSLFEQDFIKTAATSPKSRNRRTPRWTYTIGDGIHPSEVGAQVGATAIFNLLGENR